MEFLQLVVIYYPYVRYSDPSREGRSGVSVH
jgi:hypothetical protein